jgi:hypothetical protein
MWWFAHVTELPNFDLSDNDSNSVGHAAFVSSIVVDRSFA